MFLKPAHDQRRLPAVLLSGFLGSGKTTLVNALLRDPRLADTAVAINEFGEIALDQHFIAQDGDNTIVMANGCLCCNVSGDMEDAVLRIFSRRQTGALPPFVRLIIEPSGLADPAPIAQAILRNPVMSRMLRLESIVTVVDSLFIRAQLTRHAETRKQVSLADHLVLTKTDLADPGSRAAIEQDLRRLNPLAPILEAVNGAVEPGVLLPPGFLDPASASRPDAARALFLGEAIEAIDHGSETCAVSLVADQPLRWRAFNEWLRGLRVGHADQLLRLKGLLNIAGERCPVVIQGVHHVLHPPVELEGWPGGDQRSRLVLITQGVPRGTFEASWRQALPGLVA